MTKHARSGLKEMRWARLCVHPFPRDLLSSLAYWLLLLIVALALLGTLVSLGGHAEALAVGPRFASPSREFLAGTDNLGRSELPRLIQGMRTTLLLAGLSVIITSVLGIFIGMAAALAGGALGEAIVRLADVLFSFPALLLSLLIVAITGASPRGAVISIVLICLPLMVRVVRAATLTVVNRDFVVVARVGGAGHLRIMFVHLLPNVASAAVVQATYCLSVGMLLESGLSFLGLGVQPPTASLGSLVHDGAEYLATAPWLVLLPGATLALIIMAVNLLGDGLRDRLDVRSGEVRR